MSPKRNRPGGPGRYGALVLRGWPVRAAIRALPFGPLDPLRCWLAWRDAGLLGRVLRPELLPLGVVRRDGKFYARRRAGFHGAAGAGPFDTAQEAYRAWLAGRRPNHERPDLPSRSCDRCRVPFVVRHGRQRHCSGSCQRRAILAGKAEQALNQAAAGEAVGPRPAPTAG